MVGHMTDDDWTIIKEPSKAKPGKITCPNCGKRGKLEHICPYKVEIQDCHEACTCCTKCEEQCRLEV